MPIEINEIAIQLKVRDEAESPGTTMSGHDGLREMEREAIVADCVARVLRALKAQRER